MAAPACGPQEKPSPPGDKIQWAAALAKRAANPVLFALHTTPLLIARNLNYRGSRTCFLLKTIALADTSHRNAPSAGEWPAGFYGRWVPWPLLVPLVVVLRGQHRHQDGQQAGEARRGAADGVL